MTQPSIVFFDMDHTVVDIDCDLSWKYFLADEGLAPVSHCEKADEFLRLYHNGAIKTDEFVRFQLREFVGHSQEEMQALSQRHFDTRICDHIYPQALREIESHRRNGPFIALLTGTSRIIAEPMAMWLGMSDLLATEPEIIDKRFTGNIIEPFLMNEGKVKRAIEYCQLKQKSLSDAAYYADSITDVPLLTKVGQAIVVNPKNQDLLGLAQSRRWRIERWSLS